MEEIWDMRNKILFHLQEISLHGNVNSIHIFRVQGGTYNSYIQLLLNNLSTTGILWHDVHNNLIKYRKPMNFCI